MASSSNTSQFNTGDILRFTSLGYLHYAVYIGDGEIVHYNKKYGYTGIIREKLEDYMNRTVHITNKVAVVTYKLSGTSKPPEEIRKRALRYVGKKKYNPLLRNCEHFATWCVYGKALSGQTRALAMVAGAAAFIAVGTGGGATTGAILGSVFPGLGTATGFVVGGVLGFFGGAAAGVGGAGGGWVITHVVLKVKKESEVFE